MRVNAVYCKGYDTAAFLCIFVSYNVYMRNFFHSFHKSPGKSSVVFFNYIKAYRLNVTDCSCHSYGVPCAYSSCFRFVWNFCPGGTCFCYIFNHFAATKKWRHCFKQFKTTVKGTDSHWTAKLVTAHGKKVCSQLLYVNLNVRCGLCSVNNHYSTVFVCQFCNFTDWVCGAQYI